MTRPSAEEAVARGLEGRGYRVYLPRVRKVLRGVVLDGDGRRHRARGRGEVVLRPMFPRYLFAEEDGCGSGGLMVSGVVSLVGARGVGGYWEPRLADGRLVEGIREVERMGEFDEVGGNGVRVDLKVGGSVRVAGLDDRVGELLEVGEGDRSWVLLEILGRRVRAAVSTGGLVPVEAG